MYSHVLLSFQLVRVFPQLDFPSFGLSGALAAADNVSTRIHVRQSIEFETCLQCHNVAYSVCCAKLTDEFRPAKPSAKLGETGEIAHLHHFFSELVRNAAKLQLLPFRLSHRQSHCDQNSCFTLATTSIRHSNCAGHEPV